MFAIRAIGKLKALIGSAYRLQGRNGCFTFFTVGVECVTVGEPSHVEMIVVMTRVH